MSFYLLKSVLHSNFLSFSWCPSPVPGSQSRQCISWLVRSPWAPLGHAFLTLIKTLTVLRSMGQIYIVGCPSPGIFFFPQDQTRGMGFRRKTTEVECHSKHISTYDQHDFSLSMLTLITWVRWCLAGFSTVVTFYPPLCDRLWNVDVQRWSDLCLSVEDTQAREENSSKSLLDQNYWISSFNLWTVFFFYLKVPLLSLALPSPCWLA